MYSFFAVSFFIITTLVFVFILCSVCRLSRNRVFHFDSEVLWPTFSMHKECKLQQQVCRENKAKLFHSACWTDKSTRFMFCCLRLQQRPCSLSVCYYSSPKVFDLQIVVFFQVKSFLHNHSDFSTYQQTWRWIWITKQCLLKQASDADMYWEHVLNLNCRWKRLCVRVYVDWCFNIFKSLFYYSKTDPNNHFRSITQSIVWWYVWWVNMLNSNI